MTFFFFFTTSLCFKYSVILEILFVFFSTVALKCISSTVTVTMVTGNTPAVLYTVEQKHV